MVNVGKDLVTTGRRSVGVKTVDVFYIAGNHWNEQVIAPWIPMGMVADLVDDKHPVLARTLSLVPADFLKMGLHELPQ